MPRARACRSALRSWSYVWQVGPCAVAVPAPRAPAGGGAAASLSSAHGGGADAAAGGRTKWGWYTGSTAATISTRPRPGVRGGDEASGPAAAAVARATVPSNRLLASAGVTRAATLAANLDSADTARVAQPPPAPPAPAIPSIVPS